MAQSPGVVIFKTKLFVSRTFQTMMVVLIIQPSFGTSYYGACLAFKSFFDILLTILTNRIPCLSWINTVDGEELKAEVYAAE